MIFSTSVVNQTMIDSTIVGGGIGGLWAAWNLCNLDPERTITIVESSTRWGGRLCSFRDKVYNVYMERGASICCRGDPFHKLVTNVLGLECVPLPPSKVWSRTSKRLWPRIPPRETESVDSWARRCLSRQDFDQLVLTTPAWYEAAPQNARTWLRGLDRERRTEFMSVSVPMSEVVRRFVGLLEDHGVNLRLGHKVLAVRGHQILCEKVGSDEPVQWSSRHIHLALPKKAAAALQGLPYSFTMFLNLVRPLSCLRLYITVSDAADLDALINGYTQVLNGGFHWALRVGPQKLLLSYVDGTQADAVRPHLVGTKPRIIRTWLTQLAQSTLGVQLKDYRWHMFYWPEALTLVRADVTRKVYAHHYLRALPAHMTHSIGPCKDHGIDQAWMSAHMPDFYEMAGYIKTVSS